MYAFSSLKSMNTEALKAHAETCSTMKIKNRNGKEEMENLQTDYKAKKNIIVCMKKCLTFSHILRILHLPHQEKWLSIIFSCILQDIPPVPWREMAKSVPLWGLIFAQVGHDWGFFTLVTDLPKYFKDVMRFNIFEVSKLVKTGNIY
jgi:hypothetical protein